MSGRRPLKEKIRGFLDEIMKLDGVILGVLVSRDGHIMGKSDDSQISTLTFGAMSATMLASAEAAASIMHLKRPGTVEAETDDGKIIVQDAGERALITVVVHPSADSLNLKMRLAEIARRIGEEV
jgi:predicted regulator of Ras-like GTPase activity (Roadblock/LC7/MglB family)